MTTIAVTKDAMASDSLCTDSGARTTVRKMIRVKNLIVGICGELSQGVLFMNWFKDGCPEDEVPVLNENFEAIVLHANGKIISFDNTLVPISIDQPFYAIGSGKHAALGAFYMGADAKQAVKIASKVDVYSGGRISVLNRKPKQTASTSRKQISRRRPKRSAKG